MAKFFRKLRCVDCNTRVEIPEDIADDEIVSCPSCGSEYVFRNGIFEQLDIEAIDYGE